MADVNDSDLLTVLQEQFVESANSTTEARAEAELHRQYYDGSQWTATELAVLRARNQPLVHDHIGCIETGVRITSYTDIRFTIDLYMSGETALRILQYPEKYADYTRRPRIVSRNSKTKKRE